MNRAVHVCLRDQSRLLFDGGFEQFCHFAKAQATSSFVATTAVAGIRLVLLESWLMLIHTTLGVILVTGLRSATVGCLCYSFSCCLLELSVKRRVTADWSKVAAADGDCLDSWVGIITVGTGEVGSRGIQSPLDTELVNSSWELSTVSLGVTIHRVESGFGISTLVSLDFKIIRVTLWKIILPSDISSVCGTAVATEVQCS